MTKEFQVSQSLAIFGVCVPLALLLGYMLATPTDSRSLLLVSMVLITLVSPLVLRWHHAILLCCWNSSLLVFFLPGQPSLGAVLGFVSLLISIVTRTLTKKSRFISVPSVTWSLLFLAGVVVVTAEFTGGIGAKVFGSTTWGAKRYLGVLGAIAGYLALTAQTVRKDRAKFWTSLFLLSGTTVMVSDLAYVAGPHFYFLFNFFPSELASQLAASQMSMIRFSGPAWAALTVLFFLLMRYGIRGLFDLSKLWRMGIFLGLFGVSLIGGYRSAVILLLLVFVTQFCFEGLLRSRLFPIMLLLIALTGAILVGFMDRLPLSMQRSLSFLPIEIDPVAKADAAGTLDWRVQMWKILLPDVPKYLLLGKGFSFSGTDVSLTEEAARRGMFAAYEGTLINGNYHNGILTILIPFGIWGAIGFIWFCWAGLRVLRRNFLYGDPALANINTYLYAFFLARLIFYVFFYGQFDLDFCIFTGTVGLSICLNGGVCQAAPAPAVVAPQAERRLLAVSPATA